MIKKILVFEFITGGGLVKQQLPESLAKEGRLMLSTLVKELSELALEVTVLLDWRFSKLSRDEDVHAVIVNEDQEVFDLLPALIEQTDYVWPIAPEMHHELFKISSLVESLDKILINSDTEAVENCSDKYKTFEILKQHDIATIETGLYHQFLYTPDFKWVIKPRYGMGCVNSFYLENSDQFNTATESLNNLVQQDEYIVQPYVAGDNLSLSCLFKKGKGWLMCCNQQHVSKQSGQFELTACIVNIKSAYKQQFQQLIDSVAKAFKGLWGYVGIDVIVTESSQIVVVEINPRLTTSYTGMGQALGVNVAEMILDMIERDPTLTFSRNAQYKIEL